MRQQPVTHATWIESEARQLGRTLSDRARTVPMPAGQPANRKAILTRTVEDEVIPRLLLARRAQKATRAAVEIGRPGPEQVQALVTAVLEGTQGDATALVESMRDSGTPTESLLLDLLSPTARKLGQMWEDDTCSFGEVTIGLDRLGNVLRLLSRAFAGDYEAQRSSPSVLLVQMPGEQHGFGLAMVVQFFRRAGWNVRQEPAVSSADLVGIVRDHWFGVVGVSVSCSDRLEALAADIRAIRRVSRNRHIGVMVGGPPFIEHPQLADMVGADATATDGRQAVQQALSLVSLLARDG